MVKPNEEESSVKLKAWALSAHATIAFHAGQTANPLFQKCAPTASTLSTVGKGG